MGSFDIMASEEMRSEKKRMSVSIISDMTARGRADIDGKIITHRSSFPDAYQFSFRDCSLYRFVAVSIP